MTITCSRWKALILAGGASAIVAACAVGVGGPGYYDGYDGVGYVGGYYEPGGYDYGGWGGRYRVGPPRGGFDRDRGHGSPGGHAGGGGRSAPSIPGGHHR
jgi:hypothetical protein